MDSEAVEIRLRTASCTLSASTAEDYAAINASLREMDLYEQRHCVESGLIDSPDSLDMAEQSWTIRMDGDIVGFVALQLMDDQSALSTFRYIAMLSTTAADLHPMDYARLSRPVLAYVCSRARPWVTDFFSAPLVRYDKSVRWHLKTMRWRLVETFDLAGEDAALFHISRKDAEKWQNTQR